MRPPRSPSIDEFARRAVERSVGDRSSKMMRKFSIVTLAVMIAGTAGCANRYRLDTEAPNYAGMARVKVKVNDTGNREMTLRIDHLAPPHRIDPSYRAYAVWIAVPGHATSKIGLLDYDAGKRRGEIVATSPFAKFEVIVSLEGDSSTAQPSDAIVMRKVVTGA